MSEIERERRKIRIKNLFLLVIELFHPLIKDEKYYLILWIVFFSLLYFFFTLL